MKKSKKLIAMLLTLLMLLSILPVAAFADGTVPDVLQGTWCGKATEGFDGTIEIREDSCTLSVEQLKSAEEYLLSSTRENKYTNSIIAYFVNSDYEDDEIYVELSLDNFDVISVDATTNESYALRFDSMDRQGDPYTPPTPAHTHSLTKVETCSATCTTAGVKTAYWVCSGEDCGKYFSDSEGKNEITAATVASYTIPAAHTYGGATYAWNGDSCTATCTCTVCVEGTDGHSISETKKGTYVKDTDATCIAAETGHYAVTFENEQFGSAQTDANTVPNGNPIEHSYTGDYVQNEAHTQHARLCVNGCGLPGEFIDCTGGEATCQAKAVCETCEHEYGELAGHSFTNYVYNNDASCTKAGTKTAKCDNCEATDTIDDLEHPQLDHSYTGTVRANNDGTHSFKCVNGCNEYGGTAPCVDELGDGYCDICGATMDPLAQDRADAIAKLEALAEGVEDETVQKMLAGYIEQIGNASSLNEINYIVSVGADAIEHQIEIASEGELISAIRNFVNAVDRNNQRTTNKVMGIIKPILGLFGIR